MSLEILTVIVPAGETKSFMVNGQYLEIIDSAYPCDVLLQDRQGGAIGSLKNAEASFFTRPSSPFGTVQITSAQAQTIRFFVGDGDAGTRRTAGVVQVVDGGKSRTLGGSAFMSSNGIIPTSGQCAKVQLWCLPGSKRRVIVKSYVVGVFGGNTGVTMYRSPTAFTGGTVTGYSKMDGSASAVAQARVESAVGSGLVGYELLLLQASSSIVRKLEEPIVLLAGQGLCLEAQNVNINLYSSFEWTEEDI